MSGYLVAANNLSDLANIATARTNIGLGPAVIASGTGDMSATIQAALNAASGTVYFPPGKYYIANSLTLPAGVSILMDEGAALIAIAPMAVMITSSKTTRSDNYFVKATLYCRFQSNGSGGYMNGFEANYTHRASLDLAVYDCFGIAVKIGDFSTASASIEGSFRVKTEFSSQVSNALDVTAAPTSTIAVSSAAWSSGTVTLTLSSPHGITIGVMQSVTVSGFTPSGYNGSPIATATGAYALTYSLASDPGTATNLGTCTINVSPPKVTNWGPSYTISSISTPSSGYVTVTLTSNHGLPTNSKCRAMLLGNAPADYNADTASDGTLAAIVTGVNTLSVPIPTTPGTATMLGTCVLPPIWQATGSTAGASPLDENLPNGTVGLCIVNMTDSFVDQPILVNHDIGLIVGGGGTRIYAPHVWSHSNVNQMSISFLATGKSGDVTWIAPYSDNAEKWGFAFYSANHTILGGEVHKQTGLANSLVGIWDNNGNQTFMGFKVNGSCTIQEDIQYLHTYSESTTQIFGANITNVNSINAYFQQAPVTCHDVQPGTGPQTILYFWPTRHITLVTFNIAYTVINATTNINLAITYNDRSNTAKTINVVNASTAVGDYTYSITIAAIRGTSVQLNGSSATGGNLCVSASLVPS